MNSKSIITHFDGVALEYDFAVTLTEKHDDTLFQNMPMQRNRVLDIGCGSGNKSVLLSDYFEEVVGIDISNEFLQIAEHKKKVKGAENVTFLNMDAQTMDFDEKFDMIISRTTFHHFYIATVLNRCVSLLNSGGVLYIKDNVSKVPTPARWTYVAGACLEFPLNCKAYGIQNARRLFSHSISKEWLSHLASDKYLSEQDYHEIYGTFLPGCTFQKDGWAMNVIWKKP